MEQFLRQAGVPVSPAIVKRLLADGAKLTARAEHRAKRKARPGPQFFLAAQGCGGNEYDDFFCTGAIDVGIATYDPAFIQLTDTYTWSDWTRSSGSWNPEMGGSCWANPDTGFSHWYISSCDGYPTIGWYYL